ncbi:MAG: hypothetical protein C0501_17705 [Isosphaera sp.]|nr:hypothetical protein [Isosphaera sp.]
MLRLFALAAALAAAAVAVAQPAAKDPTFRVDIRAKLAMPFGGREEKVDADAAFEYAWRRDGKERTLVVEAVEFRGGSGGKVVMDARMSRAGLTTTADGKTTDVRTADAPPDLRRMLTDSFGAPICKLEVDATGKEVKRTMLAGPGAAVLLDNGMVANATLFHPPYLADKDEWQADAAVSTGSGLAAGKLTYTKAPGGTGGQGVKVSGTLTADGAKLAAGHTMKDGRYKVTGEQTYDLDRKEWVAGKLTMGLAFAVSDGAKEVARGTGTMVVTFGVKPAK